MNGSLKCTAHGVQAAPPLQCSLCYEEEMTFYRAALASAEWDRHRVGLERDAALAKVEKMVAALRAGLGVA